MCTVFQYRLGADTCVHACLVSKPPPHPGVIYDACLLLHDTLCADCYEEDPAPPDADALDPWLPEEKEAILKWRDENMGSDGNVELCLV